MQEKEQHMERQKNNKGISSLVIQLLRQENVRKTERKKRFRKRKNTEKDRIKESLH